MAVITVYDMDAKMWALGKRLDVAAEKVGMSKKRLKELADKKLCPHMRLDGDILLFHMPTLKEWITDNLVDVVHGQPLPLVGIYNLEVTISDVKPSRMDLPKALENVDGLYVASFATDCSGVYFLCDGDECVYVGQSTSIKYRVSMHKDKEFDRVFYVPVQPHVLFDVETQFIRMLHPKYNLRGKLDDMEEGA